MTEPDNPLWHSHKKQLQAINNWDASGRFGAQGEDNSWSGHFLWQNNHEKYNINISAPLSGGSIILQGDNSKSDLLLEDKRKFTEKDANSLLYKYTGLKLPVNELKYWFRGLPAPLHSINKLSLDENGQLTMLSQDNWRIEFRRYQTIENTRVPDKIFLSNHDFDVRLVIQRWSLN